MAPPRNYVDPEAAHHPVAGRPVRLGALPPKKDKRTLKLARYLVDSKGKKVALPRAKGKVVRSHLVPSWGMMGNDAYGDCAIAAPGHGLQITSATASNGARIHTPSDDEIMAAYWATGNPPSPGADDNGRYLLDVLNYWRSSGIGGSKIHVFAALTVGKDENLKAETKYAIDLFGFAYIALALPKSARSQAVWSAPRGSGPDTKPWSWGGHAVVVVDYDANGLTCVTWGEKLRMTWGFYNRYCTEAYAVLTPEWLSQEANVDPATGISPAGLNVGKLLDDLGQISA